MKRDSGMKDRDERSRRMEIRKTEVLNKIKTFFSFSFIFITTELKTARAEVKKCHAKL